MDIRTSGTLVLIVFALCACDGGDAPTGHRLTGVVAAPECEGGFEIENAQLEVHSETDELIAKADTSENQLSMFEGADCVVQFDAGEVPEAKFYSLTIGAHDGPSYSKAELEDLNWELSLSLDDAETEYQADGEETCDLISDLLETLNNTEQLSSDTRTWFGAIEDDTFGLRNNGAGFALDGRSDVAASIASAISKVDQIEDGLRFAEGNRLLGYLRRGIAPMNENMPDVVEALDCDRSWFEVSYSI